VRTDKSAVASAAALGGSGGNSNVVDKCLKCKLYFFTKVFVLPPSGDEGGDSDAFRKFVEKERGRL
jgi:hypothetical protein